MCFLWYTINLFNFNAIWNSFKDRFDRSNGSQLCLAIDMVYSLQYNAFFIIENIQDEITTTSNKNFCIRHSRSQTSDIIDQIFWFTLEKVCLFLKVMNFWSHSIIFVLVFCSYIAPCSLPKRRRVKDICSFHLEGDLYCACASKQFLFLQNNSKNVLFTILNLLKNIII